MQSESASKLDKKGQHGTTKNLYNTVETEKSSFDHERGVRGSQVPDQETGRGMSTWNAVTGINGKDCRNAPSCRGHADDAEPNLTLL